MNGFFVFVWLAIVMVIVLASGFSLRVLERTYWTIWCEEGNLTPETNINNTSSPRWMYWVFFVLKRCFKILTKSSKSNGRGVSDKICFSGFESLKRGKTGMLSFLINSLMYLYIFSFLSAYRFSSEFILLIISSWFIRSVLSFT